VVVGDLIGKGSSQEINRRRDPQSCGAAASARYARRSGDRGQHQAADRRAVRSGGPRAETTCRFGEPQRAWRVWVKARSRPVCGPAIRKIAARRTRRGSRTSYAPLEAGEVGEGLVVLISGEPGIASHGSPLRSPSVSERAPYTLAPFLLAALPGQCPSSIHCPARTRAEFARDDTSEGKLGKLRSLLAPGTRDEDFALLSELLSLPSSTADLNLSPQRKRETLFNAFLSQLEAESRQRPVLMVLEDAHWIDPTSRELLI